MKLAEAVANEQDWRRQGSETSEVVAKLAALGDVVRLRILAQLTLHHELSISDLRDLTALSQPTISHHLRILAAAGFVERENRERYGYVRLNGSVVDLAKELGSFVPAPKPKASRRA